MSTASETAGTEHGQSELTAREQEYAHKLGTRSMALFFVAFVAFLELLVIVQLSRPGGHFG